MTDTFRLNKLLALKQIRLRLSRQKLAQARRSEEDYTYQLEQAAIQKKSLQVISDDYVRSQLLDQTLEPNPYTSGLLFESIALGNAAARNRVTLVAKRAKQLATRLEQTKIQRKELAANHIQLDKRATHFSNFVREKVIAEILRREAVAEVAFNEEVVQKGENGSD